MATRSQLEHQASTEALATAVSWDEYQRRLANGTYKTNGGKDLTSLRGLHWYKAGAALETIKHLGATPPPPAPPPTPVPSASIFQKLGGFVNIAGNLTEAQVHAFAAAGGKWIIPLLAQLGYHDDHDPACGANLAALDPLRTICAKYGVSVGGWFNGWAGGELHHTPEQDAAQVAGIVHGRGITGPVVLDLELSYQYPVGDWNALPPLLAAVRARLPHPYELAVSTNSPNDAMLWNGGSDHTRSMWHLGIHLLPQWYDAPAYGQGTWMQPDQTMAWMKANGATNGNLRDPDAPGQRSIPLDWIHGTLETTGLEDAHLASELQHLQAAKASGYAYGLNLYKLETAPQSDLDLCAAQAGKLFLP